MSPAWDWLFQFIAPLEEAGIAYAVVGSVASSVYGEPRATNDLDLVIQIEIPQARLLARAFPTERFCVPPEEVILAELGRSHGAHLNIIALESMTKADLYPLPADQRPWFARRTHLDLDGHRIWVAAPEVILLHKLLFFRQGGGEKHLRDIRAMLGSSNSPLDLPWLEAEARRIGVAETWHDLRRDSPHPPG